MAIDRESSAVEQQPFSALGLRGKRVLVVASTGGHLAQAMKLWEIVGLHEDSMVVTFKSPQSERLTRGHRATFVPYVAPRDIKGVVAARRQIRQILKAERFDAVLSTGAGVALAALPFPPGRLRRIYVESFSRFDGPSLTGRIMRWWRPVETYTQHPEWANRRWRYVGDVAPRLHTTTPPEFRSSTGPASIFVSLGTIQPYRFDALVDRLKAILPAETDVKWQLGCTGRDDLPGESHSLIPADEFEKMASNADVVITHAGVGTALSLIELGARVIMVPRRAARGEHVDDHQVQVCRDFAERGLVVYREVDDLRPEDVL